LSRPPLTRRSRCGSRDIATDDLARLAIVDLNPVLAVLVRKYPLPVGVGAIGHVQSEAAGRACDGIAGAPFDQAPSAEDEPRKERRCAVVESVKFLGYSVTPHHKTKLKITPRQLA
jgi:hypothetical protein